MKVVATMSTQHADVNTGEIVISNGPDIGQEIASIGKEGSGFYSSIKGDNHEARLAVITAMSNAKSLSENLNVALAVKDVIVQHVHLESDTKPGVFEEAPRVTLITADGEAYVATSVGVFSSVKQLLTVMGEPEGWAKPVDMFAVEEKARKSTGKYMTLRYGKPSGK